MALRKISISEAAVLPLGFSISDEDLFKGVDQIEDSLREHGWKGSVQPLAASARPLVKSSIDVHKAKEAFLAQYGKSFKRCGVRPHVDIEFDFEHENYETDDAVMYEKKGKSFFVYDALTNKWKCTGFKEW